jgi:hypothetical protein
LPGGGLRQSDRRIEGRQNGPTEVFAGGERERMVGFFGSLHGG